ncbi:23S rRNA (guanosine(2251)-2'-O)-methyltransferase RlmB [Agaricicola taiwanensis]|uniref:23S rRNA (Guanosine(2251)-2'-O)-methyltransferase RlmB n=1 Tax=Agaricicola taiwanensis TaxID=591372 RepID=A0A8J2YJR6_9RHOB|nr:RNA methyltransferase [Agaricicola taiwanensis]GGE47638.1 23S rRNA (guanosine(2251)-2'-O)-methyltransferase RlmB [Agaricicola taiwanensis]
MRQGRPSKSARPFHGGRNHTRPPRDPSGPAILYGHHSVVEALKNPRRQFRRLLATENALKRLQEEGIPVPQIAEVVRPGAIDRELTPDAVHQGLLLEADPLPALSLDMLRDDALVLVLDQITDPHNVGAIVRTAAAFGVTAIVTTARHSPEATGVLAKSASGGLEHVPIITVRNLAGGLEELGSRHFQRVGLDSEGETSLPSVPLRRPLALVLGAEGKGLRQKTRTCCDVLARLDMPGAIKSLNVSNAAAIALHVAASAA